MENTEKTKGDPPSDVSTSTTGKKKTKKGGTTANSGDPGRKLEHQHPKRSTNQENDSSRYCDDDALSTLLGPHQRDISTSLSNPPSDLKLRAMRQSTSDAASSGAGSPRSSCPRSSAIEVDENEKGIDIGDAMTVSVAPAAEAAAATDTALLPNPPQLEITWTDASPRIAKKRESESLQSSTTPQPTTPMAGKRRPESANRRSTTIVTSSHHHQHHKQRDLSPPGGGGTGGSGIVLLQTRHLVWAALIKEASSRVTIALGIWPDAPKKNIVAVQKAFQARGLSKLLHWGKFNDLCDTANNRNQQHQSEPTREVALGGKNLKKQQLSSTTARVQFASEGDETSQGNRAFASSSLRVLTVTRLMKWCARASDRSRSRGLASLGDAMLITNRSNSPGVSRSVSPMQKQAMQLSTPPILSSYFHPRRNTLRKDVAMEAFLLEELWLPCLTVFRSLGGAALPSAVQTTEADGTVTVPVRERLLSKSSFKSMVKQLHLVLFAAEGAAHEHEREYRYAKVSGVSFGEDQPMLPSLEAKIRIQEKLEEEDAARLALEQEQAKQKREAAKEKLRKEREQEEREEEESGSLCNSGNLARCWTLTEHSPGAALPPGASSRLKDPLSSSEGATSSPAVSSPIRSTPTSPLLNTTTSTPPLHPSRPVSATSAGSGQSPTTTLRKQVITPANAVTPALRAEAAGVEPLDRSGSISAFSTSGTIDTAAPSPVMSPMSPPVGVLDMGGGVVAETTTTTTTRPSPFSTAAGMSVAPPSAARRVTRGGSSAATGTTPSRPKSGTPSMRPRGTSSTPSRIPHHQQQQPRKMSTVVSAATLRSTVTAGGANFVSFAEFYHYWMSVADFFCHTSLAAEYFTLFRQLAPLVFPPAKRGLEPNHQQQAQQHHGANHRRQSSIVQHAEAFGRFANSSVNLGLNRSRTSVSSIGSPTKGPQSNQTKPTKTPNNKIPVPPLLGGPVLGGTVLGGTASSKRKARNRASVFGTNIDPTSEESKRKKLASGWSSSASLKVTSGQAAASSSASPLGEMLGRSPADQKMPSSGNTPGGGDGVRSGGGGGGGKPSKSSSGGRVWRFSDALSQPKVLCRWKKELQGQSPICDDDSTESDDEVLGTGLPAEFSMMLDATEVFGDSSSDDDEQSEDEEETQVVVEPAKDAGSEGNNLAEGNKPHRLGSTVRFEVGDPGTPQHQRYATTTSSTSREDTPAGQVMMNSPSSPQTTMGMRRKACISKDCSRLLELAGELQPVAPATASEGDTRSSAAPGTFTSIMDSCGFSPSPLHSGASSAASPEFGSTTSSQFLDSSSGGMLGSSILKKSIPFSSTAGTSTGLGEDSSPLHRSVVVSTAAGGVGTVEPHLENAEDFAPSPVVSMREAALIKRASSIALKNKHSFKQSTSSLVAQQYAAALSPPTPGGASSSGGRTPLSGTRRSSLGSSIMGSSPKLLLHPTGAEEGTAKDHNEGDVVLPETCVTVECCLTERGIWLLNGGGATATVKEKVKKKTPGYQAKKFGSRKEVSGSLALQLLRMTAHDGAYWKSSSTLGLTAFRKTEKKGEVRTTM